MNGIVTKMPQSKDNQEQVLLMEMVKISTDLIKCYWIVLNISADGHLYGPLKIYLGHAVKYLQWRKDFHAWHSREGMAIDWNLVIFKMITIKGIYGREMYET